MSRFMTLFLIALVAAPALGQEPQRFTAWTHPVGDFHLQERSGKYVRARDMLGNVWVAHFFFPGCTGTCTKTTPNMKRLQEAYRGKENVRFVSIALNSDTLETLNRYADAQNADPDQWLFLTGPDDKALDAVRLDFFNMALRNKKPTPGNEILHSSHLVLVDPHGIMLGYVEGTEDQAFDIMKTEIDRQRVRRRLESRIPITGADLPRFNAILNASCTVLLLLGWIAIRLRFETIHKLVMLLALAVSMIFLASYLFYHFVVTEMEPTRFTGEGPTRWLYYAILLSHTLLAMAVAPLALFITVQGLRDARALHVRLARWTLPIWLYVSVTGVAVYWMLYRM